jgi:DNA polymerase-1
MSNQTSLKKLLLVDGSHLAFRMFFALQRTGLMSPDGRPSWAIFGFFKILLDLLIKQVPSRGIVVFDHPKPTFRHLLANTYKANRPTEMPAELQVQWVEIKRAVEYLGLTCVEQEGFEADDLIGLFSRIGVEKGYQVEILSGDQDSFQLVSDLVTVWYPSSATGLERFDPQKVLEKVGVRPAQIVDYKALVGDLSDNIPGVAGIGAKTAVKLLATYRDLDDIYQNLDKITPESLQRKLHDGQESAYLSKKLAMILTDFQLDRPVDIASTKLEPDLAKWQEFLEEYKLTSLQVSLPKLSQVLQIDYHQPRQREWTDLSLASKAMEVVTVRLNSTKELVDLVRNHQVVDLALQLSQTDDTLIYEFGLEDGRFYVLKLPATNLDTTQLSDQLTIYGFDLKPQIKLARKHGLEFPPKVLDVQLAGYLQDSQQTLELGFLAKLHLPDRDLPQIGQILHLGRFYHHLFAQQPKVQQIWQKMEAPLLYVICDMERRGVYIDSASLQQIFRELGQKIDHLREQILGQLESPDLNLNSSQQLGTALRSKGFNWQKVTKKDQITLDRLALEQLAKTDETGLICKIIEYRTLSKLRSTYTQSIIAQIDPADHRLHGQYHQALTATGRISSSHPNLQNIPIKNEEYGKLIRACFAAEDGNCLVGADYSQIELRILAHYTQDPILLEIFHTNQDVHTRTAAEIFEVHLDQVTSPQRRLAKTLNFALLYQQGVWATARMLGISNQEAKAYMHRYFLKFSRVKSFMEQVLRQAREQGFTETWWGRRRYYKHLNSSNVNLRKADERAAFNAVLQGTNADMIKLAMLEITHQLKHQNIAGQLILQVHDELVVEVRQNQADQVREILTKGMELGQPLTVPIKVEVGVGQNWAECK